MWCNMGEGVIFAIIVVCVVYAVLSAIRATAEFPVVISADIIVPVTVRYFISNCKLCSL